MLLCLGKKSNLTNQKLTNKPPPVSSYIVKPKQINKITKKTPSTCLGIWSETLLVKEWSDDKEGEF